MSARSDAESRTEYAEPEASRPSMPAEYSIQAPTAGQGVLPWTWATERLAVARGYWLATTRPDGRPHVAVVWGVWLRNRYYFATSPASRKGRNLVGNPHCVVCPEDTAEAVIVEGIAEAVTDRAAIERFEAAYTTKYGEEVDTGLFQVYCVRPVVAFATLSDAEQFPTTATRWRFADVTDAQAGG
jgi:nitroimidazol reductase NimA-like FMN-containing flavoprotein (pyridoxamine 5'-phosphate oxidase superfamily)